MTWTLRQHGADLVVCRLAPDEDVPSWVAGPITAVVRTPGELSLLCEAASVPEGLMSIGPYTAFEVVGPLDPGLVGVLAELLEPLVEERISVLTNSTFDTDWVLVPRHQAEAAGAAWRRRGHTVVTPISA
ncbi:ACT domain-containing protein [Flindersiella endophytica]